LVVTAGLVLYVSIKLSALLRSMHVPGRGYIKLAADYDG
jgi:hypothetical protein